MPADTIRKQPPKGKGKGKIGGLDWKIWAGGFVLAVAVGLYLRHHAAASAASSPTTAAAPADSGGVGGASGSGDQGSASQGIDTTGLEDAINNLGYVLGGGGGAFTLGGGASLDTPTAPVSGTDPATASAPASANARGATGAKKNDGVGASLAGHSSSGGVVISPFGILGAHGPQITPPADVNPGNVASFRVLKNGATLTTLSSGRQIEQARGKSPYVVHK